MAQQSPSTVAGNSARTFSTDTDQVVAWIRARLLKTGPGQPGGIEWPDEIQDWLATGVTGDDTAPPVLIGHIISRLTDITYDGYEPGDFDLLTPANGRVDVDPNQDIQFSWEASSKADSYDFEASAQADFSTLIWAATGLTTPNAIVPAKTLAPQTTYYWRAKAVNGNGAQISTPTLHMFKTL